MKKQMVFVVTLLFVLVSVGCSRSQQSEGENGQDYFDAAILEVREGYLWVECLDVTSGAIAPGTEAEVSTDVVAAKGVPEFAAGDKIRVVFRNAEDTTPLKVEHVFAIYLLDEKGEAIPLK